MRFVKAAKASPRAKFYNLSTAYNDAICSIVAYTFRAILTTKVPQLVDKQFA